MGIWSSRFKFGSCNRAYILGYFKTAALLNPFLDFHFLFLVLLAPLYSDIAYIRIQGGFSYRIYHIAQKSTKTLLKTKY